jgi:simple sugar transport system ATP-binding protein
MPNLNGREASSVTGHPHYDGPVVLRAEAIRKNYGHVQALKGVDFEARRGEVHALVGDNGAGKSTFIKILSGAVLADGGRLLVDDSPVTIKSPDDAQRLGIETVYQDLAIAEALDLGENIFLGRELLRPGLLGRLGFIDRAEMRRQGMLHLQRLGTTISSSSVPLESMSGGQKQAVAVARAAVWGQRVLILDEPAAALGVRQTAEVLDLVRRSARDNGLAVVFISHNVPQVLEIADRITVLRQGRVCLHTSRGEASVDLLVRAMSGLMDPDEKGLPS